jgi:hypothetical protein
MQQHAFPCPLCGVSISYRIDLDQKHGGYSFHEPTNASWVKSEEHAIKVLTFSDEIPVPADLGPLSPFIATWGNIEDPDKYREDEGLRKVFVKVHFPYAERCLVHFERGNWDLFDKESPSSSRKARSVRDRLIVLYNFFTSAFSKFTFNSRGKHKRISQRLTLARALEPQLCESLTMQYLASGRIQKLWHEIANVRRSFVKIYPHIQPLFQIRYWPSDLQDLKKINISDKKFDELRQFYIDCFETLFRLMVVAVGIEVIIHHRELQIPTKKGKMTLDDFAALPNASKISHIRQYPIEDLFVAVLDTNFRNSIGHHSAHYEASSDSVVIYASMGEPRTSKKTLGYTEFCDKVLTLFAAFELAAAYHHDLHIHVDGRFA